MERMDELWVNAMVGAVERKTEALKDRVDALVKNHEDQEDRIRKLESFMWKIIGAACIAGGIAGVGVNFLL